MGTVKEAVYVLQAWSTCPVRFGEDCTTELQDSCKHFEQCWSKHEITEACEIAIQALQEKLERDSDGWIKCSEKIPESGTRVLLCCKQRENDKRYFLNGFWTKTNTVTFEHSGGSLPSRNEEEAIFLSEGFYQIVLNCVAVKITDTITHWMPMPSLPKEEL